MWIEQVRRRLGCGVRKTGSTGRGPTRSRRPRGGLGVECLEDRDVPATFTVNTLADTVAVNLTTGQDAFGHVSLRSALQAANASPGGNTINLSLAGTYSITLPGTPGETDGNAGEFVILPTGGNLIVQNTSGGTAVVDGNHLSRVFDINPNFDPNNPASKFTATLQGFTIQNGSVTDAANPDGPNASGGGIRDRGNASLTLTDLVITNNSATADGGGVSMENTVSVPWTLTLNNTTVANNHAGDAGGGIETDGSGKVFITGGTFAGNTCVNQGGGVWLDAIQVGTVFQGATLTVSGTTFTNNEALKGTGGGIGNAGNGAATIADSTFTGNFGLPAGGYGDENAQDTLSVSNTTFANNIGSNGGGISFAGPTATIVNSTFRNNFSNTGGGLFADTGTSVQLTGDLFVGNIVQVEGGGIASEGTLLAITNTEIRGNSAATNGGGVLASGTTLTFQNSTVTGNTAGGNGGGIEIRTTGVGAAGSSITNTTISGNSALNANGGNDGGGIDAPLAPPAPQLGVTGSPGFTGSFLLANDTINGNFASGGGGIFWNGTTGAVTVENTIVAGNTGTATGPDINNLVGRFADNGGNLIGDPTGGTGFFTFQSQLGTAGTPLNAVLRPLGNNGGPTVGAAADSLTLETESLGAGSPAIGRGVVLLAPALDERGFLRPLFGRTNTLDVGAFDSQGLPPQPSSTVPTNGDVNPYGVAFVPPTFPAGGTIQPGDLLVANFNNAGNTQGTGTTLVRITPGGTPVTVFTSTQIGLDAALGFLKAGYVIVGNVPNTDGNGTPGAGSLQILDKNGNLVTTLTDSTLLKGPWYLTVANDTGTTAQVFVSNVLNGAVTRLNLSIGNGTVTVNSKVQVASGYGTLVNPAVFVAGPSGLAYDPATDTLYVASEVDGAIYRIANAATTAADAGKGTLVVQDVIHLHGPLALVLAPNGDLIVANSDAINVDPNQPSELVEYTTAGQFVTQFPIDPANGGAFGLGLNTANGQFQFAAVDDNVPNITFWGTQPLPTRTVSPPVVPPVVPPVIPPVIPPPPVTLPQLVVSGPANGTATVFAGDPANLGKYTPTPLTTLDPFGALGTNVRTAEADVNGDGIPDTVLVTGPGVPLRVAVVSGKDNATLLVQPFDPFGGNFTGGGFVAAGDFERTGRAEFVVTPDQGGGPRVSIFALGADGKVTTRANFFGIDDPKFRGGARAAVGDVNGDGTPDLVVAAGFGGGPRVAIFDGKTLFGGTPTRLVNDFFAFPGADATTLRNGVFVAAGDVNGDGKADLIFGGGPGGAPRVFILSGAQVAAGDTAAAEASPLANFFYGDPTTRGGVRVAAKPTGTGKADVVVGSGEGLPSKVRVYDANTLNPPGAPTGFQDLDPFGTAIAGGVFVG
ncbi:MAG: Flagellar hook-length control protein FliK [Gemmataceae bacterium]|nr:Flagellar hook-length control protein FliK [Gemmataceae bacterium]